MLEQNVSHGDVFHQGDGLVGAHLGHSEGGGLVVVHACTDMDWDPVMLAPSGAYLGASAFKHQLALVGRVMGVGAGRAKVVVGDNLHDVR